MKDFKSLKLLDKFRSLFEKFGVDYNIMRRIVQLKLVMDQRRVPTVMTNEKNDDEEKNYFMKSLISYGLVGIFAMFVIISKLSIFAKMSFNFGMIMFMIMTTMISDFSSVLLDIKDKNILMSKPIDSRTINMAKIIHIFIYIFIITMVIAGPSLIAGTIKYGIKFLLIFSFDLLLSSTLIIFLTSMLYYLILKFFDGEKLKDIINYVQITLSVVLIVGYQFIGRMFDVFEYDMVFSPRWWSYLIPPAWFAAPFQIFIEGDMGSHYIFLGILSILVPIVALIVYVKVIIPYFEKNLSKLNNNSAKISRFIDIRDSIGRIISKIFCFKRMESLFFRFTQRMISNERKLKLRIYPNMVFAAVMPLIIIFRTIGNDRSFYEVIAEIGEGKSYFSIYLTLLLLSNLMIMLKTSEKYKGAWIYRVLPIEDPSLVYRGAFKGFLLKYIIPAYLIPSMIFLMICGSRIFIDVILMLLSLILLCLIIFKISSKEFPFSMDFSHIKDGNIVSLFLSMGYCGASLGLHMFLKSTKYGLLVYCGVLILTILILWKQSMKIKWEDVI
ncbi:ABC transporter permease [Wukongibacter baidiensis]|uniref:ABC transporter permease n=1 Tax=Wukongibacter baidiensis TaxID=1723361 RepID=UPI003D7FF6CE